MPTIQIKKPKPEDRPPCPYYLLTVHYMYGDADYYAKEEIGKFDVNDLREIYIYTGEKEYAVTDEVIEERKEYQPNLSHKYDNIFEAIRTLERAKKQGPKRSEVRYMPDSYCHIEGFDNHLYDRVPCPREITPRIQGWDVKQIDADGVVYECEVKGL